MQPDEKGHTLLSPMVSAPMGVPPEVPGTYFKPHSALDINRHHGFWADEDASGR